MSDEIDDAMALVSVETTPIFAKVLLDTTVTSVLGHGHGRKFIMKLPSHIRYIGQATEYIRRSCRITCSIQLYLQGHLLPASLDASILRHVKEEVTVYPCSHDSTGTPERKRGSEFAVCTSSVCNSSEAANVSLDNAPSNLYALDAEEDNKIQCEHDGNNHLENESAKLNEDNKMAEKTYNVAFQTRAAQTSTTARNKTFDQGMSYEYRESDLRLVLERSEGLNMLHENVVTIAGVREGHFLGATEAENLNGKIEDTSNGKDPDANSLCEKFYLEDQPKPILSASDDASSGLYSNIGSHQEGSDQECSVGNRSLDIVTADMFEESIAAVSGRSEERLAGREGASINVHNTNGMMETASDNNYQEGDLLPDLVFPFTSVLDHGIDNTYENSKNIPAGFESEIGADDEIILEKQKTVSIERIVENNAKFVGTRNQSPQKGEDNSGISEKVCHFATQIINLHGGTSDVSDRSEFSSSASNDGSHIDTANCTVAVKQKSMESDVQLSNDVFEESIGTAAVEYEEGSIAIRIEQCEKEKAVQENADHELDKVAAYVGTESLATVIAENEESLIWGQEAEEDGGMSEKASECINLSTDLLQLDRGENYGSNHEINSRAELERSISAAGVARSDVTENVHAEFLQLELHKGNKPERKKSLVDVEQTKKKGTTTPRNSISSVSAVQRISSSSTHESDLLRLNSNEVNSPDQGRPTWKLITNIKKPIIDQGSVIEFQYTSLQKKRRGRESKPTSPELYRTRVRVDTVEMTFLTGYVLDQEGQTQHIDRETPQFFYKTEMGMPFYLKIKGKNIRSP